MKPQGILIKTIISGNGMLLTQAGEIAPEDRIFSSRVYDNNPDNWVEWPLEEIEVFQKELTSKLLEVEEFQE